MSEELARKLEEYTAHREPAAKNVRVSDVARIPGGASRQTYRFRLRYNLEDREVDRKLIARRDPPSSLIETDRRNEFEAYRAFHAIGGVPVPEMLWLEEEESWLDHPFFVMEEIAGFESSPIAISQPPYSDHAAEYGEKMYTILGRISAADPSDVGLDRILPVPSLDTCWKCELDHWEGVLDEDEQAPQPIVRAAIRWLRRNPPPPPPRMHVVHGDYRTGNFLYDQSGGIHGILDWEMVHLGDALEDLGWSLSPVFDFAGNGLAGGLLPRERAIELWQRTSGRRVDPAALQWWEVFTAVKGQAIWVSSLSEYVGGTNQDPILAIASLMMLNRQDEAALRALERQS